MRIVDLETKAYANASRLKGEALRQNRTGDRPVSRAGNPPAESERTRSRLEKEVKSYEAKIADMRESMADLVSKIVRVLSFVVLNVLCSPRSKVTSRSRSERLNARRQITGNVY